MALSIHRMGRVRTYQRAGHRVMLNRGDIVRFVTVRDGFGVVTSRQRHYDLVLVRPMDSLSVAVFHVDYLRAQSRVEPRLKSRTGVSR